MEREVIQASKLRQEVIDIAKGIRGRFIRHCIYLGEGVGFGVAAYSQGVEVDLSILGGFGFMALNIIAGEFYFMDRLAEKYSWLRISN